MTSSDVFIANFEHIEVSDTVQQVLKTKPETSFKFYLSFNVTDTYSLEYHLRWRMINVKQATGC